MKYDDFVLKSSLYLETLCRGIGERPVGSEGNRRATRIFKEQVSSFGWETVSSEFEAIDWQEKGATLQAGGVNFEVLVSPYSLGCNLRESLVSVSTAGELEEVNVGGKILLLHGDIAKEQLMPKNFVFYNPEEHQRIYALLEKKSPAAIIAATGRNPILAGGVYPFPLIEDGDFDIPSVYMTEEQGEKLLAYNGEQVELKSWSRRIPALGYNVIARKGGDATGRLVITAHIDAKAGTPGAIDNATGVIVLMLLAEMLKDYDGERMVEIVALNGEDYYAASGQMLYLKQNHGRFNEILLNINIDGAGYKQGKSAFSFFVLPDEVMKKARIVLDEYDGIIEGAQWYQGDHSIFIQNGCPALAVTSQWFLENMYTQDIAHTPKDDIDIVDPHKLVEIAEALSWLIRD